MRVCHYLLGLSTVSLTISPSQNQSSRYNCRASLGSYVAFLIHAFIRLRFLSLGTPFPSLPSTGSTKIPPPPPLALLGLASHALYRLSHVALSAFYWYSFRSRSLRSNFIKFWLLLYRFISLVYILHAFQWLLVLFGPDKLLNPILVSLLLSLYTLFNFPHDLPDRLAELPISHIF